MSPTPPALPSFPAPSRPNAPSKSVLALQGLDKALVGAEIIDPQKVLQFPSVADQDGGTGLSEKMRRKLKELGISELFAVQTAVVPFLMQPNQLKSLYLAYNPPRDVCVSAPTGSGKTLAYVLPIVEILSSRVVTRLRALVVLPTRDLVTQVRETFEAVAKGRGLKIGTATGQHSFAHEQAQLVADKTSRLQGGSSKVDILISTPGRLMDHLTGTSNFSLQHLRFLVIDEADRLLAQSFQDWLAQVLAATRPSRGIEEVEDGSISRETALPTPDTLSPAFLHLSDGIVNNRTDIDEKKQSSCQKLLFSATLTRDPSKIAALNLHDPKYFVVQSQKESTITKEEGVLDLVMEKFSMPATLTEHMVVCESSLKPLILFHLVHSHAVTNALVFTKSAESTTRLVRLFDFFDSAFALDASHIDRPRVVAQAYSSDLSASERKSILDKFKSQEIHILVCSDLISRGIDISHVSHVVSYDAPVDMRKYVHRVGRTARAGRAGDAWTLVEEQEARYFKAMLKDADHLHKVKRLRISDKDLALLRPLYEIALRQLKEIFPMECICNLLMLSFQPERWYACSDAHPIVRDESVTSHLAAGDIASTSSQGSGMSFETVTRIIFHSLFKIYEESITRSPFRDKSERIDTRNALNTISSWRGVRRLQEKSLALSPDYLEASVHPEHQVVISVFGMRKDPLPRRFWHVSLVPKTVPPPKESLEDAEIIPETTAGWWSLLTFGWITALLKLGYARPLEASDLYKLQDHRSSAVIADKILASFKSRSEKAAAYNARLASGEIKLGWRALWWSIRGNRVEREKRWRDHDGRQRASLVLAMNDSVKWWFWSAGLLKLIADVATVLSPLLVKALINFATESYSAHRAGQLGDIPPVGKGVGIAIGLLAIQTLSSLCTHHFFYRATSTGVLLRGGLITAIYDRSLKLTSRARSTLTNGKLVNHISTDVSRIDFCCGFMQLAITAPVQMVVCLIILLTNLGPSALAGFAFFILCTPIQTMAMRQFMKLRQKSMAWTDKRAKLLQELLAGMKIIKCFAWEIPYLKRIRELRAKEMSYIRSLLIIRSANNALGVSLPALASVLSFVVYSATGHSLDPANIFSSLTLFQLLRMPLMFLPLSLGAITDARNAVDRLYGVFEAETLSETKIQDEDMDDAIEVVDAEFTWDGPAPDVQMAKKKKGLWGNKRGLDTPVQVTVEQVDEREEKEFQLKGVSLSIPRGQLTAIVGLVGSGKSSLLQGLIGEMRKTTGTVRFRGSVAYCPQSAWIQNATVRDSICFGRPFEEEKYWKVVQDACLEADLELLPNGDLTEVGERGISLSGGQKQRINICRAIYVGADIQIFDDPFSALDAHVGKSVFQNVFKSANPGTTRILVTHALHFLPQVDYIYTIVDGHISEHGTYTNLISNDGDFACFIKEFGAKENQEEEEEEATEGNDVEMEEKAVEKKRPNRAPAMMQTEERNTGAVSAKIYKEYLKAGKGAIVIPLLIVSLALLQGAQVMSSYWLVYWQELKWNFGPGFYMGIYAGLGVAQALTFFMMGSTFAILTYFASQHLHRTAINRVMHAPMSFFETTPLGRIMNRFSKDIDTVDNMLGDAMRIFVAMLANIMGAIILIAIVLPWFLIAVAAICVCYIWAAMFYRASARELKRLDALLRSSLYSHFSESLSGLATIRAYGETDRFLSENRSRVDIENRAYWLTVTNQRWLGIRLDFLGLLLTFIVAMLTVGTRFSISPSQTGVVLSYIISVQQAFGWMVRQSAEVENDFNSVERIVHYATELEQEPPHQLPDCKLPSPWPSDGSIQLRDVVLKYRPELPAVLRGLSMTVRPGEKIGIVGRTGAGKSSIMTALYRLVELSSGSVIIDGVDISQVGLTDLRNGLAIIPQDPLLFSGTLRSNLDPFGVHDDVRLWDALKRAYLVEDRALSFDQTDEDVKEGSRSPANRFSLDSPIEDEGGNLSIGQRSLVSLARALVKDTRILILDEATASVDYETDRKIQDTIAHEFEDRTILCIAHRLRTIIGYDRICVLNAGEIAEFDSPHNLYNMPNGIFRSMCDRSSISLDDIKYAAKEKVL
ncbi:Oligomycin resistance ATP-dependent permease YOR1 [Grifola frondosa]|uniref:Oligomycin resistance ATP-dependent permease YOR1 n=1 Tax=Grifola frondosa TaxID=5627 RepID=A0A1C7M6A8_GRIFR|nr:Oligomycin resistance ATP-dependent permease YOR1 [Grifola frondosa]